MSDRVELQVEVFAPQDKVFELLAAADGLRQWLDDAELDPRVGGKMTVRLRAAVATGEVLAFDPPQHISFSWDWVDQPLGSSSVLALDAIDHGPARTHVTLRHVGLPTPEQVDLHTEMWRYWLKRFAKAVRQSA